MRIMMRRMSATRGTWLAVVCALATLEVAGLTAQIVPTIRALTEPWPEPVVVDGIEIVPVQKDVYFLAGGGGNVVIAVSDQGVTMVDAGAAGQAARLQAAVRRITRRPLRLLVNTSSDPDHVGGNGDMVAFAGGAITGQIGQDRPAHFGTAFVAHENSYLRMLKGTPSMPPLTGAALPVSSFFTARKDLFSSGQPVQLFAPAPAHTDGDLFVFFRSADVIAAGDIFRTDRYPMVDLSRGGSIDGVIDALNAIVELTVPERNQMGGTRVVPGHGRLANESDVVDYRDMLTIIRDRVQAMVEKGNTLAQIQAANLALEYDGTYGRASEWSGAMFLESVYNSLAARRATTEGGKTR
jgi:glyoxylase-like metal-dependent hydrolase (beta-lactamase superfamily II)